MNLWILILSLFSLCLIGAVGHLFVQISRLHAQQRSLLRSLGDMSRKIREINGKTEDCLRCARSENSSLQTVPPSPQEEAPSVLSEEERREARQNARLMDGIFNILHYSAADAVKKNESGEK